ncbi:hypothetical protein OG756_39635 [Streptomyces sp. NBC_01310]|uniref:hypothetical protein n=1 Tax=Streptomyces sp. NBC_01310 TaxID=2903820 RepID=UPI0035B5840D|nr:hypothetical protein OG756_39635 [Streptomyces sp. NBC_01310]
MPDSHDPLRSLFREAASAGSSASALAPVSVIEQRGERVRRRRIAGIAVACCLVLAGSGAALAAFLPAGPGPTLPATTPSPGPLTRSDSPPPAPRTTTEPPPGAPTGTTFPGMSTEPTSTVNPGTSSPPRSANPDTSATSARPPR